MIAVFNKIFRWFHQSDIERYDKGLKSVSLLDFILLGAKKNSEVNFYMAVLDI